MKTGLCIDNHVAVASDLRKLWAGNNIAWLRHICMSGHAPYLGIPVGKFQELEGDSWCTLVQSRQWDAFADKYMPFLDRFDFFVSTMPPIWALLYAKTEKPIVLVLPVRYEYGATGNAELWHEWNEFIRARTRAGTMAVVANNEYDQWYFNRFLPDVNCTVITSICDYTGMQHNPVRDKILYYASWDAINLPNVVRKQNVLHAGHSWQSVAEYKAVLHIPYNVSTMSMYEHRAAEIPIIAPTKRLMRQWREERNPVLNQVSWNEACNQTPGSVIKPATDGVDPNDYTSPDVFNVWLDKCELYNGAIDSVRCFDSIDELAFNADSLSKRSFIFDTAIIKENAVRDWEKVLRSIGVS